MSGYFYFNKWTTLGVESIGQFLTSDPWKPTYSNLRSVWGNVLPSGFRWGKRPGEKSGGICPGGNVLHSNKVTADRSRCTAKIVCYCQVSDPSCCRGKPGETMKRTVTTSDRVAVAIAHRSNAKRVWVENTAIRAALSLAVDAAAVYIALFLDTMSSLPLISGFKIEMSHILEFVKDYTISSKKNGKTIVLWRIPSHVGIGGD